MRKYYIFGAHSRGQTTSVYLRTLYPEWTFLGFLYANDEENSESIDGYLVKKLSDSSDDAIGLDTEAAVYIGTRGIYFEEISQKLKNYGFTEIIPVDMDLDNELRNRFIPDYFKKQGRSFRKLETNQDAVCDKSSPYVQYK